MGPILTTFQQSVKRTFLKDETAAGRDYPICCNKNRKDWESEHAQDVAKDDITEKAKETLLQEKEAKTGFYDPEFQEKYKKVAESIPSSIDLRIFLFGDDLGSSAEKIQESGGKRNQNQIQDEKQSTSAMPRVVRARRGRRSNTPMCGMMRISTSAMERISIPVPIAARDDVA